MAKRLRSSKIDMSTILTILGGIGVIATAASAIRQTPKAMELIESTEQNKGEKLSISEKVITTLPTYIPTILIGTATLGCVFSANVLNKKKQATMASAYALLEQSYRNFKRETLKTCGERTYNEINRKVAAEESSPVYPYVQGFFSDYSQYLDEDYSEPKLFYDANERRFFYIPFEQLLMAEYHINRIFTTRGYVTLNDFYEYLGLKKSDYGAGVGWAVSDEMEQYWIDFNHRKSTTNDGSPYYVIETSIVASHEALDEWM